MAAKAKHNYITQNYLQENYIKEPIIEYPNGVLKAIVNPKVTVFTCTYQHKEFIRHCLEGILSQKTNFDFEVLIGEDESSDGTREICMEYAQKFPEKIRLFLHRRENNVQILGKPCGIFPHIYNMLQARGKYIAVCGGDDFWTDSSKLQVQYDYLAAHPDCPLVYQPWKEKTIHPDDNYTMSEPLQKFPKASTSAFINFNNRMPVSMLSVIQEDEFRWFILSAEGYFQCIENIAPVIVNTPVQSITRSLSKMEFFRQALNLKKNIYYAFKDTSRRGDAKVRYVGVLSISLKGEKYKGVRVKCFRLSLQSLIRDGLFFFLIGYSLKNVKKLFSIIL